MFLSEKATRLCCWANICLHFSGPSCAAGRLIFCEYFPKFILFRNADISASAALILHFGYAISYILYYVEGISVTPCSVGLPSLVLMNNMSSHIYRDMRFGFYTTRSSVVNRALEGSFIEMDSQNPGDNTATWRRLRGLRGVAMLPT